MNRWLSILVAGLSFVLMHGIVSVTAYAQFGFYMGFAIFYGLIFVLWRRLLPLMIIHLLFTLSSMMAIFQAAA